MSNRVSILLPKYRWIYEMKTIPLVSKKHEKVAIVSDEDYERLTVVEWGVQKGGNSFYAVAVEGRGILMHRVITGAPDNMDVDHKDGNGLHNWRENLRVCTEAQNQYNQKIRKDNTTGYKGVHMKKGKYCAQIHKDYKKIHIGYFFDPIEAAKAYDAAARELFGEFAKTNF